MTWHDMTWHDMTWHDMTWHDMTWHDMTWHDTTRHDTTRHDTSRHDTTRHDTSRHDTTRHVTTRHDTSRHVTSRHDTTRHDTTRHVTTRHVTTRHVTTRHDTSRHATPRHATPRHATPRHVTLCSVYLQYRCVSRMKACTCFFPNQQRSWSNLHTLFYSRNLPCLFVVHIEPVMLCHWGNRCLKTYTLTIQTTFDMTCTQIISFSAPFCGCNITLSGQEFIPMQSIPRSHIPNLPNK